MRRRAVGVPDRGHGAGMVDEAGLVYGTWDLLDLLDYT
jgi:hypothetical protein